MSATDVLPGDVWEYTSVMGSLCGERRTIASIDANGVDGSFTGTAGCFTVKNLLERARLISRAGQPVTAEHDRSGCATFCGLRYSDSKFPPCDCFNWASCGHAFFEDTIEDPIGWCSARCRDLRLPPMRETETTQPVWRAGDGSMGPPIPVIPKRPPSIQCRRCLVTSERGNVHVEACPTTREHGPSAVASAPPRVPPRAWETGVMAGGRETAEPWRPSLDADDVFLPDVRR